MNLDRCMAIGCTNIETPFVCKNCELGWCSVQCRTAYSQFHPIVCHPKYPIGEKEKTQLCKVFSLDKTDHPRIGNTQYKVITGPIPGVIPNFCLDRVRDKEKFNEWFNMLTNKSPNGEIPSYWYYVMELDRTLQFMCFHLNHEQKTKLKSMNEHISADIMLKQRKEQKAPRVEEID